MTTRERREQLKKAIEDYEFFNGGYKQLNGVSVGAINVKENKTGGLVTADVTVYRLEEGSTRHNDCEYPLEALEGK